MSVTIAAILIAKFLGTFKEGKMGPLEHEVARFIASTVNLISMVYILLQEFAVSLLVWQVHTKHTPTHWPTETCT